MKIHPKLEGKIFFDPHCHLRRPKNRKEAERLVEKLSSGITGITAVWDFKDVATYEQLVQDLQLKEINPGLLAMVKYYENTGYIIKTQEVGEHRIGFHILTLGCQEYIDDTKSSDSIRRIYEIHKQNGLAIITHPFTIKSTKDDFLINKIFGKPFIRYRLINEEEESRLINYIYPIADEIETFNAQNIRAIPFILDMTRSNKLADQSVNIFNANSEKKFEGIASSDTHFRLEQIQKAGIYLPKENESYLLESILENIKQGNFERYEQYISRPSFVAGMFPIIGKIYDLIPKHLKDIIN